MSSMNDRLVQKAQLRSLDIDQVVGRDSPEAVVATMLTLEVIAGWPEQRFA